MKKMWILTSAVALLAGCSSYDRNRTAFNDENSPRYVGPNDQGGGAAALTEHGGVNAPGYGTQQSNPAGAPDTYEGTGTATASSGQLAAGDAKFIDEASRNGQAEVKMGQLIAQDAADPDVKRYGQMLIDDHTKLNQQLAQLASQKGATVPMDVDPHHQRQLDHLGSLSGADFNKAALKDAIRDHGRDIRAFQDAAQKCQDSDVKSFAQQALPTLQQHLQRAKELDEEFSGHTTQSSAN